MYKLKFYLCLDFTPHFSCEKRYGGEGCKILRINPENEKDGNVSSKESLSLTSPTASPTLSCMTCCLSPLEGWNLCSLSA